MVRSARPRSTIILWVALTSMPALGSRALAAGPRALPRATLTRHFAAACAVKPGQVTEVRAFDLLAAEPEVAGFVVGTFREPGDRWNFPALVPYRSCAEGVCPGPALRLGAAAARIGVRGLVDLDAPRTSLGTEEWLDLSVREPSTRPRWPVLVLGLERQGKPPTSIDAVLVSLRRPGAASLLVELPVVRRWTERVHRGRGPRTLGQRAERLVLARNGDRRELELTVRPIDSPHNRCLQSAASLRRFVLRGEAFVEEPSAPAAAKRPQAACP